MNRQQRAGQVAPEQPAEIPNPVAQDREPRQHRDPALAGERPVPLRIARAAKRPVAVQIQTRGEPTVGPQRQAVRVGRPGGLQPCGQRRQRAPLVIPVETLQRQDIGPGARDHLDHGDDLRILAPLDVAQQKPRPLPLQLGIEAGNPQGLGVTRCAEAAQKENEKGGGPAHAVCTASVSA